MDLLFDLDGTLTNSSHGITACIQYSLRELGQETIPSTSFLERFIGPPLQESFAELLQTSEPDRIDAAIRKYRERFVDIGIYENEIYEDIPDGLARLRESGHRLWVATSKPQIFAQRITDHFDISRFFEGVYGSELDGTNSAKAELIAHISAREGLLPSKVYMIGDRAQDILGGRANGTGTIGVLWGFGSESELREAGADVVVGSVAELLRILTGPEVLRN